eukprot:TRINITY_DN18018_c0_g1_i2.p1 TRINITY_DN18018_c0_g1~~TRINITY_DN18018_c0_g1_i2.p1  ORF type:complete len:198 (+),score=35.38 TRINITY_DN18018_c0_g1_i2:123-716(+)
MVEGTNDNGETLLFLAAQAGNLEEVNQHFVESSGDLETANHDGLTPFHAACREGHLEVMDFLATHKANLSPTNRKGYNPIMDAAEAGQLEVVQFLVNYEVPFESLDNGKKSPMSLAFNNGHNGVVRYLVSKGADFLCIYDEVLMRPELKRERDDQRAREDEEEEEVVLPTAPMSVTAIPCKAVTNPELWEEECKAHG